MTDNDFTSHIDVTRKVAAQRQIDAAIVHLRRFELECAITLAAAAETMLPDTTSDYVFDYFAAASSLHIKSN